MCFDFLLSKFNHFYFKRWKKIANYFICLCYLNFNIAYQVIKMKLKNADVSLPQVCSVAKWKMYIVWGINSFIKNKNKSFKVKKIHFFLIVINFVIIFIFFSGWLNSERFSVRHENRTANYTNNSMKIELSDENTYYNYLFHNGNNFHF